MTTEYYDHTTYPANGVSGSASAMRTELEAIETGFSKLPTLASNGSKIVAVNSGATALEAITTTGTGSGVRATSPSIASPALTGTPTAPTASVGTSTTQIATTAFVAATSLVSALPGQTGNSGKFVTTDGANASWAEATPGNYVVVIHTGNGHGSSSTKIRLFTTTMTNTGSPFTISHSATLGTTLAALIAGLYVIHYADVKAAGSEYVGITLNSAELTTNVPNSAVAARLAIVSTPSAGLYGAVTCVARLAIGDILRCHTEGGADGATDRTFLSVRRIGV